MKIFSNFYYKSYLIIGILNIFSLILLSRSSLSQGKEYLIGHRDILALTIFAGGEKQQDIDLAVSEQGMVNIPFIGAVKVIDLTISQLEEIITDSLGKDYFVEPEITIHIKEYHSLQYYISGAVKQPGLYETSAESSLLELIARAGGVLPERGNVAYILRASAEDMAKMERIEDFLSKEPVRVDLKSLLDKGDMNHNLLLKSGDVVYIPLKEALNQGESKIYVEGEVKKPGVYDYQPGITALKACIISGGFGQFAAPNRAKIIRNTKDGLKIIRIDLTRVKEGKISDIELEPGDRIHVPETWF